MPESLAEYQARTALDQDYWQRQREHERIHSLAYRYKRGELMSYEVIEDLDAIEELLAGSNQKGQYDSYLKLYNVRAAEFLAAEGNEAKPAYAECISSATEFKKKKIATLQSMMKQAIDRLKDAPEGLKILKKDGRIFLVTMRTKATETPES